MTKHPKILLFGFLISFAGSLPVGSLNLTACKLLFTEGINAALVFFLGVILVELLLVWGTLKGLTNLRLHKGQMVLLQVVGMMLLVYLAIDNISAMEFTRPVQGNSFDGGQGMQKSPFMLGVFLSMANPLQIPFWAGWNTFLIQRKLLSHAPLSTFSYLIGIGWGTLLGMALFVVLGNYFIEFLGSYDYLFSVLLSLFYLGFAIYLAALLYKNHLKPIRNSHV